MNSFSPLHPTLLELAYNKLTIIKMRANRIQKIQKYHNLPDDKKEYIISLFNKAWTEYDKNGNRDSLIQEEMKLITYIIKLIK